MRILLTNDDGIDAEGLQWLAGAMSDHGEVIVVAPDREYSGSGASLGVLNEMQPEVHRTDMAGASEAWTVAGPPALCVLLASLGIFGHSFDMVVAGINPGINVGRSVYHSGTVGAALTGRSRGMSAVAVSQAVKGFGIEGQGWDEMLRGLRWESAAEVASAAVGAMVDSPPRAPVLVNLNVPNLGVEEMAGWQRTSVGRIPPRVIAEAGLEPRVGHPRSFKVAMKWGDAVSLPEGTDGGAVERGIVSVTLLGHLTDVDAASDTSADEAAHSVIGAALDQLFEKRRLTA